MTAGILTVVSVAALLISLLLAALLPLVFHKPWFIRRTEDNRWSIRRHRVIGALAFQTVVSFFAWLWCFHVFSSWMESATRTAYESVNAHRSAWHITLSVLRSISNEEKIDCVWKVSSAFASEMMKQEVRAATCKTSNGRFCFGDISQYTYNVMAQVADRNAISDLETHKEAAEVLWIGVSETYDIMRSLAMHNGSDPGVSPDKYPEKFYAPQAMPPIIERWENLRRECRNIQLPHWGITLDQPMIMKSFGSVSVGTWIKL